MRRQDHIRQRQEVGMQRRLVFKHIQTGRRDAACSRNAAISAASSTMPPRAMLTSVAVGFISASSAAPIVWCECRRCRADQHDVVRLLQQFFLADILRVAFAALELGASSASDCDRSPACRNRAARARNRLPDAAHADNTQYRAVHVGAREQIVTPLFPFARAQPVLATRSPGARLPSAAPSQNRRWFRSARRACWSP